MLLCVRTLLALCICTCVPTISAAGELTGSEDQRAVHRPADGPVPTHAIADEAPRSAATHAAFERGLQWLASRQEANLDGSMPIGAKDTQPVPIAATALGALAMMAGGSAYERGPYGSNVARAIDYLVVHTTLDPSHPAFGYIGRSAAKQAVKMHSFGFAALALAQAYSTSPRSEHGRLLGRALEASVRLIERTQGKEGAWYYEPKRMVFHEGSVTIALVQVLRAARNSGIRVDATVIARAEEYVQKSQVDDGLFAYQLGDPDAHTSVALTAAALCTLYSVGEYASETVDRGLDAISRELALRDLGEGTPARFPYYERLYLAQALWQHADPQHFERWSEVEFRRVLAEQEPDGRWRDTRHGDGYATAVNCLVLAMSEELLPIFQR